MRLATLLLCICFSATAIAARGAGAPTAFQAYKERWRKPFPGGRWLTLAEHLLPTLPARELSAVPDLQTARKIFDEMAASRIGFGFPDGMCLERAEVTTNAIARAGYRVERVFARGRRRLEAATPNTESGRIRWSYHTSAAVRVRGVLFVLDPALFSEPVPVEAWAKAIRAKLTDVSELPATQALPESAPARARSTRAMQLADALFVVGIGRKAERMRARELRMRPAQRARLYEDRIPLTSR